MPVAARPTGHARASTAGSSTTSSPSKPRRESANKAMAAITGVRPDAAEVEIEDFHPPTWRSVLNTRADLGYPDFYPSRPGFGQPEDVLTEENVKNGFTAKPVPAAGAESFSMHGPINQFFLNGGIKTISTFADDLLRLRESSQPSIGERSFRMPPRVTYNDLKRLQFLSDLANPDVPLSRLMRSNVPHGFKGVELFDAMFSPATTSPGAGANRGAPGKGPADPIPIDRAIWFIRVLGASDIAFHRGRIAPIVPVSAPSPAAAPTPASTNSVAANPVLQVSSNDWHTQEFTSLYTSWLRIQLSQLQLPAIPKVKNAPPPKLPLGVLGDEQARSRWLVKWEYSCTLLRELHDRRFLSNRVLMSWMSDYLSIANLAQVGFVAELIAQYLPHMARHAWIGRQCARAICDRIVEVRASPAADAMGKVEKMLEYILTALVEAEPEVLLTPITWRQHGRLLTSVLGLEAPPKGEPDGSASASPAIPPVVFRELQRRNSALLYTPASSESTTSPRRHQMEEIHKLDSLSADTNMSDLCKSFFDGPTSPTASPVDLGRLSEKISILLNWALAVHQLGIHRPYGVYTLIKMWQERRDKFAAKNSGTPTIDLFPILYEWLDTSSAARKEINVAAIGITFGEFTRQGLFSIGRYIQTLIARGQTARTKSTGGGSHHLALLRGMPIFVQAKDLLQQRRIALCGDDIGSRKLDEAQEERVMAEYKEECKEFVPEIFGLESYGRSAMFKEAIDPSITPLQSASRHILLQARFWVFPAAAARLPRNGKSAALDPSTFVRVMQIYRMGLGYSTIADFLVKAIQLSEDEEIFRIVVDTLRRDADVWTAMDRWKQFGGALMERHQKMESSKQFDSTLTSILREMAAQGRLSREDAEDVEAYAASQASSPATGAKGANPKESLLQLAALLKTGDEAEAALFAPKFFSRLGRFDDWSAIWWNTLIDTLAAQSDDAHSALSAALAHINQVCDTARSTLDTVVSAWLDGLSPSTLSDKLALANGQITRLLLHLVVCRRLSTITLLNHMMLPIWKYASSTCLLPASQVRVHPKSHIATELSIILASQLLLNSPPDHSLPPSTLQESLIAQTSRAAVLRNANVLVLIRALPYLVIVQSAKTTSAETKDKIAHFLASFATIPQFKTAAFRHLDTLKDTFLSAEWTKPGLDPAIEAGMVDTLKAIMSEGASGSTTTMPALGSGIRLSAWRWTRVVLEMRLEFKRLAMRIENNEEAAAAKEALRKMVQDSLDRDNSPDDVDLLCETLKGIEPVVSLEVLGVGLDRLCALLSSMFSAESSETSKAINTSMDLVLRVMDTAKSPTMISEPGLLSARHRLLDLLAISLQSIEGQLSPSAADSPAYPRDASPVEPGETFSMVMKLLRFALGLRVKEPTSPGTPKPDFSKLAVAYFKVISLLGAETHVGEDVRDMLVYILDSAPSTSRAALWTNLMAEASALASSESGVHLADALPYASPPRRYTSLSGPLIDDGTGDSNIHLDDRPWELFEQMDPPPRQTPHQLKFLGHKPVKDSSSIPMAFFNPQIKRDEVPADLRRVEDEIKLDDEEDIEETWPWRGYASERNLGDGFAGEPMSARQYASRMYVGLDEALIEEELSRSPVASTVDAAGSPANSLSAVSSTVRPRRMSIRIASTASTAGVKGSSKDPITIEEDESSDDDSDSDIEEEAPPTKRSRLNSTASKTTATAAKHPTTGGKAPARKTTGGKNVARKATGGKRFGGKAPSKGAKRH